MVELLQVVRAFVCGDYNIDLLKITTLPHNSEFFDGILSSGFLPAITLPTRLSDNSTLIDNILYNKPNSFNFAGILTSSISDHQPILINTTHVMPLSKTKYITIYCNSDASKEEFRSNIESKQLYNNMNRDLSADPNENYNAIETAITKSRDLYLGKKTVRFNRRKHRKDPWITHGILKSVNTKNKLYKRLKKTKSTNPSYERKKQTFNGFKNALRKIIRKAKKDYYSQLFSQHKNDIKKTWQTLSVALNRKSSRTMLESFMIDDEMCSDQKKIADTFNNYFATICTHNRPNNENSPYTSYLSNPTVEKFEFKIINREETLTHLSQMKPSHSCGHDSISNNLLKIIKTEISDCLTLIINQSITTGIYPDQLKIAKVVPIHKKNDKLDIKNYRPISVLPTISKLFEIIMHSQLMTYFTDNKLLTPHQYGFRPNLSTELATLELMDRNIHEMAKNKSTPLNIFIDLSKAFDSLNHMMLINKLKYYGIQSNAIALLQSYLFGRSQYVQINNVKSSLCPVLFGIPQGSVMGPFLFNVFINDICNVDTVFDMIMYADDTTLISTIERFGNINDPVTLENRINFEIEKINKWLYENELLLNADKSKFLIFFKPPKKVPKLQLKIDGRSIAQVEEFNFLGITIDQSITWKPHTTKISTKISRVIGILRKLQHIFPQNILITIYYALVHSHINYGLMLWGYQNKHIFGLQKKAVRVIAFRPYIAHTEPIFKSLRILKLDDLYSVHLHKLYYRYTNNLLPSYFECLKPIYSNDVQTSYNLRNNNLRLPFADKEYFVRSTKYQYFLVIRNTPVEQLRQTTCPHVRNYAFYYKSRILETYDLMCHIAHCYVCMNT